MRISLLFSPFSLIRLSSSRARDRLNRDRPIGYPQARPRKSGSTDRPTDGMDTRRAQQLRYYLATYVRDELRRQIQPVRYYLSICLSVWLAIPCDRVNSVAPREDGRQNEGTAELLSN